MDNQHFRLNNNHTSVEFGSDPSHNQMPTIVVVQSNARSRSGPITEAGYETGP